MKIIQLDPAALCPCGSGKLLRECCLLPDGLLRKQPPTLLPPPPRKDHAQPGCYLASTMDCSPDLSGEHYMSKSVLEAIGPDIAIDGVPWLPRGKKKRIGINSLTANILCKRHNQTLSPLDDAAGKFFRKLQAIHVDLQRKSLSRKHSLVIMSGETLELWMLKLACGLFYSKNAAEDGARLIVDHHLNEKLVQEALFQSLWHDGCGLYMKAPQGPRTPDTDAISMEPLIAWSENQVVGSAVTFAGLEFELIFDAIGVNKEQLSREGLVHRPSELRFRVEKRAHSVSLTWVPGTPPRLVEMTNTVVRKKSCSQKG